MYSTLPEQSCLALPFAEGRVRAWAYSGAFIMGPEMMDEFRKQAKRFGAECLFQTVESVDFSKTPFIVNANNEEYCTNRKDWNVH